MKESLINKLKIIIGKGASIEEEDVRSFMVITRKILDAMSEKEQNSYLILRLFCNWSVHIEITDSNTGLRLLARINDSLVSVSKCEDNDKIRLSISESIGFVSLRREIISFLHYLDISDVLFTNNELWAIYLNHLVEIIRDVPISFPLISKLDKTKLKIYNQISQNQIKEGAGVIAIKISLIKYPIGDIMSILITTEDTTTLIIPLLIDVRLR